MPDDVREAARKAKADADAFHAELAKRQSSATERTSAQVLRDLAAVVERLSQVVDDLESRGSGGR